GNEKTLSLEDLCQKRSNPMQRVGLKKLAEELIPLAVRANPALRSIVQDYQQLVAQLALGKNHAVETKLRALKTLRARLTARMSEIDDYLNWFEATQLQAESGLFDNAVSASATVTSPRRKDAFSAYLDAMEAQF